MTHAESSEHGGPKAAEQPYFPSAEWESFQADDRVAAKHIVSLIMAIFTLGLVGYFAVFLWIRS